MCEKFCVYFNNNYDKHVRISEAHPCLKIYPLKRHGVKSK